MIKMRCISVFSLVFAIISFYFELKFFEMAYWGSGLTWFWVGVSCDYICAITAIVLVLVKKKDIKLSKIDANIRGVSVSIAIFNLCFSTFLVIGGLSGM